MLEDNKAYVQKLVEAINKHNIPLAKSFIAKDYVEHTLQMKSPEGFEKFLTSLFGGFPDFKAEVEDIIAEGDKVCVRGRFLGTQTGMYYDPSINSELAPTGRKISVPFCITYRLLHGKAIESWTVENLLDFCKQLDLIEFK